MNTRETANGQSPTGLWLFFILLPVACFFISLAIGQYQIGLRGVFRILAAQLLPLERDWTPLAANMLLHVRLPRVCASVLVGIALSVSGAAFQGIFRNPLASPYTLGISNGAGFGAAIAILFFGSTSSIQFLSMAFSLAAVALTFLLSGRAKHSTLALVLAGIVVGAFFSALISLVKFVADPFDKLPSIVFWLMGSLSAVNSSLLLFSAPFFILGTLFLLLYSWRLNLLSIGDEEAASFGVDVRRDRALVILCCTALTAAAVGISGIIGWVGLVIPHLGRILVGPDFRKLLPACISLGASHMLVIDNICRASMTVEIPLGVITAVVGTPIFAYFMLKQGADW